MQERYLEDFAVGQVFHTGEIIVDKALMMDFAARFDPQPFHIDEEAARTSFFGGLVASGWYTAALTMRLLVESEIKPAGGLIGAGFDAFQLPLPVRAGDKLYTDAEVIGVRPSRSRPRHGLLKMRTTTTNQRGESALIFVVNLVVARRLP